MTGTRGSNAGMYPSPLPSRTHQIMDAFLWNEKKVGSKNEQKKHEQAQSLILSRLRISAVAAQSHEVRPLVVQTHPHMTSLNKEENGPNPKNTQQTRMNHRGHSHSHHSEERSPNNTHRNVVDQQQHQTRMNNRGHNSHHSESRPSNNQPLNVRFQDENETQMNQQRGQNTHHHIEARPPNKHPPTVRIAGVSDDDDDVVCCDRGHCHEGTKNLCTLSLWAFIVFLMVNRFFVHMAMHLHKNNVDVSPKYIDVVPTAGNEVGQVKTQQYIEGKLNFTAVGIRGGRHD
eukprot:CAMPEP_0201638942 /NCGR_PEP_ID=MMETSP0493-20130528/18004_1 /ASSEMBLY_ACC=CAM_ASM_000838 /TAXON_ID=420259 /ORGANISM="Thalassiosira gravida, Strain GMp14c1" /LENGTH=286 /DNA_ID=CAMNT_0048112163 /DNA_START=40 /DNA_END=900 /DNA_ORIENTATION=-